jgi:hypothetical protein
MSVIYSENSGHRAALLAAEQVRQSAAVPGASQSTLRAADIAFYCACLASAVANGLSPAQFEFALREIPGTGGA